MQIYVRARKDKALLDYVNEKVYDNSLIIKTFCGKRKEELIKEIEELKKNPEDFTIVLLGNEDRKWINEDLSDAVVKIYFVPKKKVRNTKPKAIVKEIEIAKSRFILDIRFIENYYILGKRSNFLIDLIPGSDIFLIYYSNYRKTLSSFMELNNYPLVWHTQDTDYIYAADKIVGKVFRSIDGPLKFIKIENEAKDIDLDKTIKYNLDYIKKKEEMTIKKIKLLISKGEFDRIIVPWSGGKDSTLLVALLKKHKIEFTPIYVDTGLEFDESKEYIDKIARKLGIKYETVYAGIDKALQNNSYSFLLDRKCTVLKISSLYKKIKEIAEKPLIINGDRISESESRSFRPELRKDNFWVLSPIKYWSYLDEQLYFITNDIPINPLYELGFYRVGCYVCPFIDVFEKFLLKGTKYAAKLP